MAPHSAHRLSRWLCRLYERPVKPGVLSVQSPPAVRMTTAPEPCPEDAISFCSCSRVDASRVMAEMAGGAGDTAGAGETAGVGDTAIGAGEGTCCLFRMLAGNNSGTVDVTVSSCAATSST